MEIFKGTKVIVQHSRKGTFKGIALRDFDTKKEEWYPIVADENVQGLNTDWEKGEETPCRASLCKIKIA